MNFLLIGFHSVGKASIINVSPDGVVFSGLVYKANAHFIPVFCFCIFNWINNAVMIVWVRWYGSQSVFVCVIKHCVCVLVIFEKDKLL